MASIGESQLVALCKRNKVRLPSLAVRGDARCRSLMRMWEIADRWDFCDPPKYEDIKLYFRGLNDKAGKAPGKRVWLDLCTHCGQDRRDYDAIPGNDPMKLSIEHWFKQCLSGDREVFRRGLAWMDAVELGINNSGDFKTLDGPAQAAFLGNKMTRVRRALTAWTNTGTNHTLPSLCFLQSTFCPMDVDTSMFYLCSGLRHTGMTRQLFLSPAMFTRASTKRVLGEDASDGEGCSADTPPTKAARVVETTDIATQCSPVEIAEAESAPPTNNRTATALPRSPQGPSFECVDKSHTSPPLPGCMTSRKKYQDFAEGAPVAKQAFVGPTGTMRNYVAVTCPHCKVAFVEIPIECIASKKASKCKTHLETCSAAKAAGVDVSPLVKSTVLAGAPVAPAAAPSESADVASLQELMAKVASLEANVEKLEAKSATTEATLRLHGAEYVAVAEKLLQQEQEINDLKQNLKRSLEDNREQGRTIRWFEKKLNEYRDNGCVHMLLNAYQNRGRDGNGEAKRVKF